jgi:flagellin
VADLSAEIDRIAAVTQFNGAAVLNSTTQFDFQVGVNNTTADRITVTGVTASSGEIGISAISVGTQTGAQSALGALDTAIANVASLRAGFGTVQNRL